ncbi:general odorant-binding protein 72-like [Thrips palmi]|uniref:General odorant-binding protein 72-like n=1 Tax=Thrips palmi TaxID=161013 RepID=A0A6P8YW91_THRPL|nr:general odorant-binding protein 72-like [Thrips palmi]
MEASRRDRRDGVSLLLAATAILALTWHAASASPVVTDEQLAKAAKMVRGVCQPKTGATDAQLDALASGILGEEMEVKCYMGCLMATTRTIKNGKIDAKMMKMQAEKMMPPHRRDATIESLAACKDETGADNCELAFNYLTCAKKFNPEKFFFPA